MGECCSVGNGKASAAESRCPGCGQVGKPVALLTLKSLLKPEALERLDPQAAYAFCATPHCPVVYFGGQGGPFDTDDVKVAVYQKDPGADVPVCYCFGWTRRRIQDELARTGKSTAAAAIAAHVKAGRCGCEVNNPQGACCLGNVQAFVRGMRA
ncbi:putative iron-sulfur cluster-binding metallochaperone [Calditerricola satsumensis]|uniref:(2Fe-2S)-binding protein n=1 Tax=Calditerricola satsumensis TaxID=373054 RepID=A0A8J3B6Q9_9BACI|nr:copper chaperone Copz family protein [Calditerricola satsumensis]GGJ92004.1 (2Fe-2S)-binding protein [Calditerricola satsumensis]